MHRMYSLADKSKIALTLAHANAEQSQSPLFDSQHFLGNSRGAFGLFNFLRKSEKWLQREHKNFDVMHSLGGFHQSVAPAFAAHQLGLPTVLFIANHRMELIDKPGLRSILGLPAKRRKMIRDLSCLVSMSRDIYHELREYKVRHDRIARIPMGVDLRRFRPVTGADKIVAREQLGIPNRPTIIFSGRIEPRKRPHLLVEVIAELVNRRKIECQLLLVGPAENNPEYASTINQLVKSERLQDFVYSIGFTREIEKYLQAADIFSLPSKREGMPAAMVEAMASGLPCIGTAISGIRDLIDDKIDGRIVEPNVNAVSEAVSDYIKNPHVLEQHSQLCVAKATERYSATAVLNAHLRLFRILGDGGQACDASILPETE